MSDSNRESKWPRFIRAASVALHVLTLAAATPALANMGAPAVILTHWSYGDFCESTITDCHQIVRNAPYCGEFLLQFFVHSPDRAGWDMRELNAALRWPDSWYVYGYSACAGGTMEWSWGGDAWLLRVNWPECCRMTSAPLLAFSMWIGVSQPGELEFREDSQEVTWGCPEFYWESVFAAGATAGTDCAYTNYSCGDEEHCIPRFDQPEIRLTAPAGGSGNGTALFSSDRGGCSYWFHPREAWWLSGTVSAADPPGRYKLELTGDARSLPEGIYQTWARVYDQMSARYLLVTFEVQGTSAAPETPVRQELRTWGGIKSDWHD